MKKIKTFQLNIWQTNLFAFFSAVFIMMTSFFIQPSSFLANLKILITQPLIIFLNLLPVVLLIYLCYFIFGNVFYSAAGVSIIFNIFSFINSIKIETRDDPLVFKDLGLAVEGLNSVKSFSVKLSVLSLIVIIFTFFMFLSLGFIFKSYKNNVLIKTFGSVASVTLIIIALVFLYPSKSVNNKIKVSNEFNATTFYNESGFIYNFLHSIGQNMVEKPEGYEQSEVLSWIEDQKVTKHDKTNKPNILFVMCETFSDITNNDVFDYPEDEDPLKFYNSLIKRDDVISGHLVVPNFGGGTANTEFDVMTGMQTNMISENTVSAFRVIRKKTFSIANLLSQNDYHPFFFHPGDNWFYNRKNVYPYLGIDDTVFNNIYEKKDFKGNMISDESFFTHLTDELSKRKSSNIFTYSITIQNHMSYLYSKYKDLSIEDAKVKKKISDEANELISVYIEGIRDSDKCLENLVNYVESQNEPTVLVFFGDHLPSLGNNYLAYNELGIDIGQNKENTIEQNKTPFIIYQNKKAKGYIDEKVLCLPKNKTISASFLGVAVLDGLGIDIEDKYLSYVNDLRKEIPVIFKEVYYDINGNKIKKNDKIDKLKKWQYYRMTN